ncbi:DUF4235 domain-containing protein [Streptomyces sp. GMY02]|uniref:DUF4235 domain-containing protein n=1 Tax=Streptomyces sp. GMY02 TaxID=1333528 RepID=UPI0020B719BD|nr:DUF4235 domain-containing protein [Streptomyces sp. GMY02]
MLFADQAPFDLLTAVWRAHTALGGDQEKAGIIRAGSWAISRVPRMHPPREVLLAAAVQGAIFALVRSAVDRSGATAIERATDTWPSDSGGGRD